MISLTVAGLLLGAGVGYGAEFSALWGERGERWNPQSRLPDFSFEYTDLDAGAGTRLWKCGGGAALGKHCGARGTFWNIRSATPLDYPPAGFGPASMNLVGLETKQPSEVSHDGKWFEVVKPDELQPRDLHEAQLRRRLGSR